MGGEEKEGEGRGGTYYTLLDSTSQPKSIVFNTVLTSTWASLWFALSPYVHPPDIIYMCIILW